MGTPYPPQSTTPEIDTIWWTLNKLGFAQWMPPTHDGMGRVNQFVYGAGDATPNLIGTDAGAVVYSQGGKVDEILGGSPAATFAGTTDRVSFPISGGDDLQMSAGGTWLFLGTLENTGMGHWLVDKTINGKAYSIFTGFTGSGSITFETTVKTNTAAGVVQLGKRHLIICTLSETGDVRIYVDGVLVKSSSGTPLPPDIADSLIIGNHPTAPRQIGGPVELVAVHNGVVLDQPQITNLVSQCGRLG